MRWMIGSFFVVAFASLASTGHAVAPGAMTTTVEAARETASVTQEVARRHHARRPARQHRRVAR